MHRVLGELDRANELAEDGPLVPAGKAGRQLGLKVTSRD